MKKQTLALTLGLICASHAAQAITINAIDSGYFELTTNNPPFGTNNVELSHDKNNQSIYFGTTINPFGSIDGNGYVIYDLTGVTEAAISASIEIPYLTGSPSAITFYQATSHASQFNASYSEQNDCTSTTIFFGTCTPLGTGFNIYNDLASGYSYGSVSPISLGTPISMALDSTGLNLINASLGSLLVIGIEDSIGSTIVGTTLGVPSLNLQMASTPPPPPTPSIPEPTSLFLFGAGLFGLVRGLGRKINT